MAAKARKAVREDLLPQAARCKVVEAAAAAVEEHPAETTATVTVITPVTTVLARHQDAQGVRRPEAVAPAAVIMMTTPAPHLLIKMIEYQGHI